MNSQRKGKKFELEVAKLLNKKFGTNVRRTPQSGGMDFKGDIIQLDGILSEFSFECKHQENLNFYKAQEQAERDCPIGKTPLMINKRNFGEPYVRLKLNDFLNILLELEEWRTGKAL